MDNNKELEHQLLALMLETSDAFNSLSHMEPLDEEQAIKSAVEKAIEIYIQKYQDIVTQMEEFYTDPDIALKGNEIEKQIRELAAKYNVTLKGTAVEEFFYQINTSTDYTDLESETIPRTEQEKQLIAFMDETLHTLDTLSQLDDIDSDTIAINGAAIAESIAIYRQKYGDLLEQMGGFYSNPNIMLKESQIEQKIKILESRYRAETQPDINTFDDLDSVSSENNEPSEAQEEKNKLENELMNFMNESYSAFNALLQIESIDIDTHEATKTAAMQSVEIYRSKFSTLLAGMGGFYRDPNILLMEDQIEQMIQRLESQYGKLSPEPSPRNQSDVPNAHSQTVTIDEEDSTSFHQESDPIKDAFEKAAVKSQQDLLAQFEQKYSLADVKDVGTLSKRLHDMLYDGLSYSSDSNNAEKTARFQLLKQVVPQYSELRSAIITLRGMNLEYEDQLLKSMDLENISYQGLLDKAVAMIQSLSQPEKSKSRTFGIDMFQLSDSIVDTPQGAQDKKALVSSTRYLAVQDRDEQVQLNQGQR